MIDELKLSKDKLNKRIFRLSKFLQWIIVDEKVRQVMNESGCNGFKFKLVDSSRHYADGSGKWPENE